MKKQVSVSPLSILMVILISGVFYSVASAAITIPLNPVTIKDPVGVVNPVGTVDPVGTIGIDPNLIIQGFCGDNKVGGSEQCDDGNTSNLDACLNDCTNAVCGDGLRHLGVEDCDDGNSNNADSCLNNCNSASCGDGVVRAGVEQCDDGNLSYLDGCTGTCQIATCGDGFVRTGVEDCDDGNSINGDGCSSSCTVEIVGPTTDPPDGDVTPTFSGVIVTGVSNLEGNVTAGAGVTATGQPTAVSAKALFNIQGLALIDAYMLDLNSVGTAGKTAGDMVIYDDLTVGPNYGEAGHWASPVTMLYGVTRHLLGPIVIGNVNLDNNTVLGEVLYIGDFDAWNVPADRRNDGDVVIQGDLTVGYSGTGKIYADQVGSRYRRSSYSASVMTGVSCDAGSVITGCSGYSSSGYQGTIPSWGPSGKITTCWAYSSNNVSAFANCFDPTGVTTNNT